MNSSLNIERFQSVDANPGATLQKFNDYVQQIELLFQFKKAMLLFKGGKDMKNIFQHVSKVL